MSKLFKALALAGAMISCAPMAAAQTPGGYVDVPGGKLWYETCGSGPKAMVLIHDGVLHSAGWDDVWPALCKSFRVVRYDRRGYGRSPEAKAPYSPVDDLQAVVSAADLQRAVVVGASNGGGLAVDFALAHPDEVERLVLVGAEVSGLSHSKYFMDRLIELQGRMARGDLMGAAKSSWLFPPGDDADVARLLKLLMASPQDLNHKDPAFPRPPAAAHLAEIKAPTLVLVGEFDQADNQAQSGVLEYAIPGATRVVVPKSGHLIYMTRPAEFADIVSRFASGSGTAPMGEEATLRRAIEGLQRGDPDYGLFNPAVVPILRARVPALRPQVEPLGAIRSTAFKGQGPGGADIFIVAFDKGSLDCRIVLGPDGKIAGLFFKPAP
jgi:3-oxoadipate enol-lactonase